MDNTIYRVALTENFSLEIYICDTNDVEPYAKKKEIGIVVFDELEFQQDGFLTEPEIDSLISYLENAKRHIANFNRNNKQ